VLSLLAVVVVGGIALTSATDAHFRRSNGDWFYAGHTHHNDQPRRDTDPITLFYHGDDRHIDFGDIMSHWIPIDGGFMRTTNWDEPGCSSSQALYDLHPRRDDHVDHTYVTHCYQDKWHIRAWDSVEHDQDHPNIHSGDNVDKMGVSGVHHDDCCSSPTHPTDRLDHSWENSEKTAKHALRYYCSWRDAIILPGSKGRFQKMHSDGKVTRISPMPRSAPGDCR